MTTPAHPGAALGLPPSGPGSAATLTRRAVALVVDWVLSTLIAVTFFGMQYGQVSGRESFVPLAVLVVENVVLVATLGTTVGHRLLGLRVVSIDGDGSQPPPPGRSLVRALLLGLFVPAMILDADGRGLHDKAARSVVLRAR